MKKLILFTLVILLWGCASLPFGSKTFNIPTLLTVTAVEKRGEYEAKKEFKLLEGFFIYWEVDNFKYDKEDGRVFIDFTAFITFIDPDKNVLIEDGVVFTGRTALPERMGVRDVYMVLPLRVPPKAMAGEHKIIIRMIDNMSGKEASAETYFKVDVTQAI